MISSTAVSVDYIKDNNILIIGCPASGKTYLSNKLKNKNHTIIHCDDFIHNGYKNSLYHVLDIIKNINGNTIVEGILGYRLLRKGIEFNCYYPDIVFELEISEERLHKTYRETRIGKSFESISSFNARNKKILNDYFEMDNIKKPKWIKIKNDY